MLEAHGASRILASFHDIAPNWIFAGLYFPDKYLAEKDEMVRKVIAGLEKSFAFIAADEEKARSYIPKYTNIDPAISKICALREYGSPKEPLKRIYAQQQLMIQYGYLQQRVKIDHMIDYGYLDTVIGQKGQ
jgi:ABC-type nitrate/sulfonate/bicarbonate transport system substrate-binding protein